MSDWSLNSPVTFPSYSQEKRIKSKFVSRCESRPPLIGESRRTAWEKCWKWDPAAGPLTKTRPASSSQYVLQIGYWYWDSSGARAQRAHIPSGRRVYSGSFSTVWGWWDEKQREGPGYGGKLCHGSARSVINATLPFSWTLSGAPRALIRMLIYHLRLLPRAPLLNGLSARRKTKRTHNLATQMRSVTRRAVPLLAHVRSTPIN